MTRSKVRSGSGLGQPDPTHPLNTPTDFKCTFYIFWSTDFLFCLVVVGQQILNVLWTTSFFFQSKYTFFFIPINLHFFWSAHMVLGQNLDSAQNTYHTFPDSKSWQRVDPKESLDKGHDHSLMDVNGLNRS